MWHRNYSEVIAMHTGEYTTFGDKSFGFSGYPSILVANKGTCEGTCVHYEYICIYVQFVTSVASFTGNTGIPMPTVYIVKNLVSLFPTVSAPFHIISAILRGNTYTDLSNGLAFCETG